MKFLEFLDQYDLDGAYWLHVVSCLVSPEVVSGRCAVGKCV